MLIHLTIDALSAGTNCNVSIFKNYYLQYLSISFPFSDGGPVTAETRALKCVLLRRQGFSSSPHFTLLHSTHLQTYQAVHENWLFII